MNNEYKQLLALDEICSIPDPEYGEVEILANLFQPHSDFPLWELIPTDIELCDQFRYHVVPGEEIPVVLRVMPGESRHVFICYLSALHRSKADGDLLSLLAGVDI